MSDLISTSALLSKYAKLCLRLALIALLFLALWWSIDDVSKFFNTLTGINPLGIIGLLLTMASLIFLIAVRWRILCGPSLGFFNSLETTTLYLGYGMLLPGRAGELARLYFADRVGMARPAVLANTASEKILDMVGLLSCLSIGLGFGAMGVTRNSFLHTAVILGSAISVIMLGYILRNTFKTWILTRWVPLLTRIPLVKAHESRLNHSAELFFSSLQIRKPILSGAISLFLWIGCYGALYSVSAYALNIEITYLEAIGLVFWGAIGFSIPLAPSGLGTFHTAIVSGFLILGKSADDGLALAILCHGIQFIFYVALTAIAHLVGFNKARITEKS